MLDGTNADLKTVIDEDLEALADDIREWSEKDVTSILMRGESVENAAAILKGKFMLWVGLQRIRWHETSGEFGFRESYSTLTNYRQVFRRFGALIGLQDAPHYTNVKRLSLSKLYELAAPSFPADQVQAAIDAFVRDSALPEALQVAVDAGDIGPVRAGQIATALRTAPPLVRAIGEAHMIGSVAVVRELIQISARTPELVSEILQTGAVQGGSESVPISEATASDIRAAYVEARYNGAMDHWFETREVIAQHTPVIIAPNKKVDFSGLVSDDQVTRALTTGGVFYITLTYCEPAKEKAASE